MPLSIEKLSKVLLKKKWIIRRLFTVGGMCVYIEMFNLDSANRALLYIPSKYDIEASDSFPTSKIHYLEVTEEGNVPGDYGENEEAPRDYTEIDIDESEQLKQQQDIEGFLTEGYKCPISLKEVKGNDIQEIKEIFRQLKRLKYCVENLKYKICIVHKCYLCCLKRDNSFECYSIEGMSIDRNRKLIITTDLETLYEELAIMDKNVLSTYQGIIELLEKNETKNNRNIKKMIEYKNNLVMVSRRFQRRKEKYKSQITRLNYLLDNISQQETEIFRRVHRIHTKYNNKVDLGIHMDMEKTLLIQNEETKLRNIRETKQEVLSGLLRVRSAVEDVTLKLDQICFDNIVMFSTIIKNFDQLTKI